MRKRLLMLLTLVALPAALAGCKEPEDPPNPEVVPGAPPVVGEPGMTTGQVPEAIDENVELREDTAAGAEGGYTP